MIDIAKIKTDLLCFGVRLGAEARQIGTIKNSYLLDGGFVHAAHFIIDGVVVNTCVSEEFCKQSPYEISIVNSECVLKKEGLIICPIEILPLPEWCLEKIEGYVIGDYLRPHSPNCISCSPILQCAYDTIKTKCKFCSIGCKAYNDMLASKLPAYIIVKMLERALQHNSEYEIALSGGTSGGEDRSALYFAEICDMVTKHRKITRNISVELAPPEKDEYIERLFDSGATSLIMNIEIVDEAQRSIICPGKSIIPLTRYFSAMKTAVSKFGRGRVSSVLIAGIQPSEDIVTICKKLIPMGVIPTIIPFKPLDSCLMSNQLTADPDEVLSIAEVVNVLLNMNELNVHDQGGCTKCGGCSLESLFQMAL